jgi:hypothetical protein
MISPKITVSTPANTKACQPVAAENAGGSCESGSSACIDHLLACYGAGGRRALRSDDQINAATDVTSRRANRP